MFATYSVPGTDIVFACVMFALVMALAYIVGRIHKLKEINESIETFKWSRHQLCKMARETDKELEEAKNNLSLCYKAWSDSTADINDSWEAVMKQQRLGLSKKHRAAMVKYKAKCDAKLVKYIDRVYSTGLAELRAQDDLK